MSKRSVETTTRLTASVIAADLGISKSRWYVIRKPLGVNGSEGLPAIRHAYQAWLRKERTGKPTSHGTHGGIDLDAARARHAKAKAESMEIAVNLRRKQLLNTEQVEWLWNWQEQYIRTRALKVPAEIASAVWAAKTYAEKEIVVKKAIHTLLTELSGMQAPDMPKHLEAAA